MDTTNNSQIKFSFRTGKMAQWVKSIVTKPYDLSLIPGAHLVEGDPSPKVSSDHHIPLTKYTCSNKPTSSLNKGPKPFAIPV